MDENGYFFNRETGKSYNVRIPKPGNLLANFYHRPPSETIKTSLGEFYATVQNSEGFSWKLLSLADGSICGAMNMDNKILVPVEDRAYELEYKDSLFFGRQEGAKGLAFVYAANGDVIIPRAENYNSISLDVGTESFFKATRFVENSTMDDVALYDLKGNKGPNTVGKDIGFITVLYPTDSEIVAPYVYTRDTEKIRVENASEACTALDSEYRVPNRYEVAAMFLNNELLGLSGGAYDGAIAYPSSSFIMGDEIMLVWTQSFSTGTQQLRGYDVIFPVRCVKR